MAENVVEFGWTKPKEQAALLLAEGKLTDVEIADKCAISVRQLYRWKAVPEFEARRLKHVADWIARVEGHRLAHRAGRLERRYESLAAIDVIKQERGAQLTQDLAADGRARVAAALVEAGIEEARAREVAGRVVVDEPYAGGARTGYIVRDYKGKDADVPTYAFDAALYREERSTLMEIADELGQLVKRSEITGKDGAPISITITADDERL